MKHADSCGVPPWYGVDTTLEHAECSVPFELDSFESESGRSGHGLDTDCKDLEEVRVIR